MKNALSTYAIWLVFEYLEYKDKYKDTYPSITIDDYLLYINKWIKKHNKWIEEHNKWIEEHNKWIEEHNKWIEEHNNNIPPEGKKTRRKKIRRNIIL